MSQPIERRLINIWGTLVWLGDRHFCGVNEDSGAPGVDFYFSKQMRDLTHGKQVWFASLALLEHGGLAKILSASYGSLKSTSDSYLACVAPGFNDLARGLAPELCGEILEEVCRRAMAFNKRVLATLLGEPPGCPAAVRGALRAYNDVLQRTVERYKGHDVDLTDLDYLPWDETRLSRPRDLSLFGERVAQSVLHSHSLSTEWLRIKSASSM